MLAGQRFSEAILPLSVDSKISLHGIDVDVFQDENRMDLHDGYSKITQ
jgi:hypothetical protein